jgi:TolB-like protein
VALRKEFQAAGPDPLVIERDFVGLDPARIVIDAREFLSLATSDSAGDLDRAIDLYKGEFLDGLELDIEPFNEWLRAERARIAARAAAAFERSATRHDAAGGGPAAIRAAERLAGLDPLRESAQRLLLRILAKYRGRDSALAHAEALAERVRGELDSELEPETEAVIAEIRAAPSPAPAPAAARRPDLPLPVTPSIAVLPFANLSDDPAQAYFADGVTEDITTALSRLRWLFVIARNSAYVFKDKPADVRAIARELGVRYILEGSVRAVGQRIRITGQLVDAEKGKHIWAQKYDRELHDIFAVQDEITEHIWRRSSRTSTPRRAIAPPANHRKASTCGASSCVRSASSTSSAASTARRRNACCAARSRSTPTTPARTRSFPGRSGGRRSTTTSRTATKAIARARGTPSRRCCSTRTNPGRA